jgi:hypothetical protein
VKRYLDSRFWAPHFRSVFVTQIEVFARAVRVRLLPTFDAIEREAQEIAEAEYRRIGELPGGTWSGDMADADEYAHQEALGHYEAMTDVQQSLMNLVAAALFHLVEQQRLLFHRKQVLHPRDENDRSKFGEGTMRKLLKEAGVDLADLPSWPKLQEMRLLANTVKHGEGRSADELRAVRPDLLTHPMFRGSGDRLDIPARSIRTPLGGDGVYVTPADLDAFAEVAVSFWNEFADAIEDAAA